MRWVVPCGNPPCQPLQQDPGVTQDQAILIDVRTVVRARHGIAHADSQAFQDPALHRVAKIEIALMLPAFFMAMYERDGLPFEKVARNIIRAKFLRPGVRPYQTQNIYAPFAGKEVTLEQKPQEVKKPDAGR